MLEGFKWARRECPDKRLIHGDEAAHGHHQGEDLLELCSGSPIVSMACGKLMLCDPQQ